MVQGTTSHAGKSLMATALCRIFRQDGLRVAPFKAQNMSLNSFVTPDGGEFGRAQAVQADAARVAPTVEMNPILLKPEGNRRSQVVVMGKPMCTASAREYYDLKLQLWHIVTQALDTLRRQYDIVVIEGAGSPAEINLKQHEIVNMRVARYANAPVIIVGDIDRGGVFASLYGTMALLEPAEQALVKAFIINKFRGDPSLLDSGFDMLLERTGVPVAGVIPYFDDIHIPEEDSLGLPPQAHIETHSNASLDIAVIRLPRIANFDDFDPLRREPSVWLRYVATGDSLAAPDLIVIPGSKTTAADLEWMRATGISNAIVKRRQAGTPVIGICGGYQMLGERILDPHGVESQQPDTPGMGLLPMTTVFAPEKSTHQVRGSVSNAAARGLLTSSGGADIVGYEIHMGRTYTNRGASDAPAASPFRITERSGGATDAADGAIDADGVTLGTYMHGLFHNHTLRRSMLLWLAQRKGVNLPDAAIPDLDGEYDKLADLVRRSVDLDAVYTMAGLHAPFGASR